MLKSYVIMPALCSIHKTMHNARYNACLICAGRDAPRLNLFLTTWSFSDYYTAQFSNIVQIFYQWRAALPTITENTATLLSEAQRQDDNDREPFASDCCIIYFHHVHLAVQVTGINAALV